MTMTKYGAQVAIAQSQRQHRLLHESLAVLSADSALDSQPALGLVVRELDAINRHITVDSAEIGEASNDYDKIADHLVEKLRWPRDAIYIYPQGSVSTRTLIRAPDRSKFDIDAVCQVDISRIEARDPMRFFEQIGEALGEWEAHAKKRCWRIEFANRSYYIEFTPSVPLEKIPVQIASHIRYRATERYRESALAVVDTPSEQWKTSNPAGFTQWVDDQAKRPLLLSTLLEKRAVLAADSIAPVPEQEVPLSDTLRVAIRLLKRHRDMAARKGLIDGEVKPISVIVVTLLTQCYEGLADNGNRYTHPIELLADLAELMPGMIEIRHDGYWIANPTVEGENFAERWNENPERKAAFDTWCALLIDDLEDILTETDTRRLTEKIRSAFGTTGASTSGPNSGVGLAAQTPKRPYTPPATKGLA